MRQTDMQYCLFLLPAEGAEFHTVFGRNWSIVAFSAIVLRGSKTLKAKFIVSVLCL